MKMFRLRSWNVWNVRCSSDTISGTTGFGISDKQKHGQTRLKSTVAVVLSGVNWSKVLIIFEN